MTPPQVALLRTLREGSTDGEARLLVDGSLEDTSRVELGAAPNVDASGASYREERMFLAALVERATAGDKTEARVRTFAISSPGELIPSAARMLLGDDEHACETLTAAHADYQKRCRLSCAEAGKSQPSFWRLPQKELRRLADAALG